MTVFWAEEKSGPLGEVTLWRSDSFCLINVCTINEALKSEALELGEESMRLSKSIIRPKEEIERLKEVALKENRILKQRWSSQECQDVVSTWMSKA